MGTNVGSLDRILRIVVGVALIAFALYSNSAYAVYAWIGVVPLLTSIAGWCPAYTLLGVNSCPMKQNES